MFLRKSDNVYGRLPRRGVHGAIGGLLAALIGVLALPAGLDAAGDDGPELSTPQAQANTPHQRGGTRRPRINNLYNHMSSSRVLFFTS